MGKNQEHEKEKSVLQKKRVKSCSSQISTNAQVQQEANVTEYIVQLFCDRKGNFRKMRVALAGFVLGVAGYVTLVEVGYLITH
jgi:hypothetical protein